MAVLVRIAMIFLGYVLACIAASLILTVGTLTPEWDDLTALGLQSVAVWAVVLVGAAVLALSLSFGLDFAGYSGDPENPLVREREVLAAAGIAGGFVYWLFAGRKAGSWK
jgi:4-amino-4-deoxy-L-arabinose transferase-like glycosyltransferase